MSEFTEDEQLYSDLDWYAVDREGRIGQFLTGGNRLLPPKIALDKVALDKLSGFFENLPFKPEDFSFCPDLTTNARSYKNQINEEFMPFSQKMASKGLYSYDSDDYTYKPRPYFRVAIPKNELKLENLPEEIRNILENLKMREISFAEDSLIQEEIADKL